MELPDSAAASLAYDRFRNLRDTIESASGQNEDTTRLRAIDTILIDVLGWPKTNINSEKYVRTEGYSDYCLLVNETITGVLEAKKDGVSFLLKDTEYSDRPVSIAFLAKECKDAHDALAQAFGYSAQLGSRYVAISNGHQWLISLGAFAGQPFSERSVLVFESLDAIDKRFRLFFYAFSPTGFAANSIADILLETRQKPAPQKMAAKIPGYPRPADRNEYANEIGWVLSLVWDNASQDDADKDFLEHCYVKPKGKNSTLRLAKEIIKQRRNDDEVACPAEVVDQADARSLLEESRSPEKPIIVLGRIGHGKSTFLDFLRLIDAASELEKYIQIDIDFLDRPAKPEDIEAHALQCVDEQLLSEYSIDVCETQFVRAALHGELERFKRTPRGGRHAEGSPEQKDAELDFIEEKQSNQITYLSHAIRHLKRSHRASIAIYFDNLDRRPDIVQEEAFLFASKLARDWECLVFVCLRPGTFYRSTKKGVLDTIAPKTINVSPPEIGTVLRKRFRYASAVASGSALPADALTRAAPGKEVSLHLPSVETFFNCCESSFRNNRELLSVFEAASSGNIRSLLRYVRDFLVSQHLNTRKIVDIATSQTGYTIAAHEAIRALLYGQNWDYSPSNSPFPNIFDISRSDPTEHFLQALVLERLHRQVPTDITLGFISKSNLMEYVCQLGFGPTAVGNAIDKLVDSRCIENKYAETLASLENTDFRITDLGRYILTTLCGKFTYIDAMFVDTPVIDDFFREDIADAKTIRGRVERARKFCQYLDKCSDSLQDEFAKSVWDGIHRSLKIDIYQVSKRIEGKRR